MKEYNDKQFINARELELDALNLVTKIRASDFKPNFMLAIWRGGSAPGLYIQEALKHHGVETDHTTCRTSSYEGIGKQGSSVAVHSIDYVVSHANADDNLLIVDDVWETGKSVKALIDNLRKKMRFNFPNNVAVATIYYKPNRNQVALVPDFYLHISDKWLVFPHEFDGLTDDEIRNGHGEDIFKALKGNI